MSIDDRFLENVMRLWSRGMNTADIAKALARHESVVEWALHVGLEQRKPDDSWQKLGDVVERIRSNIGTPEGRG